MRSLVRRTTRDVVAVAGIGFTVQPGEVVGFLGPNGAGKTTTLKMLAGHASGWLVLGSVGFTVALAAVTRWIWRLALRRYSGASS